MKKTSLFAAVLATAGYAWSAELAETPEEENDAFWSPLGLAIASPVGICEKNNVYGLDLDLFYHESRTTYGVNLGMVSRNKDEMAGLSVLAGVGWVEGDMYGLGLSGLANSRLSNSYGVDVASILNYTKGEFIGLQMALVNVNGEFRGVQLGVFNHDNGVSGGLQFGIANADVNEYTGWSLGLVNCAVRFNGLQLGFVNFVAEKIHGVQVGVFNGAENLSGVQIGLLNLIGTGSVPVMPVFNAQF